jgi:hypothetical protein
MKRAACALALCASLFGAHASADSASDLQRAKESFKAGATAYAAGDYQAAIQALDAAYQLTPLPAIAFSLAQAERRQYFVDRQREHLDRAISLFHRYLELSPTGTRRSDSFEALAQLEPMAASLVGNGKSTGTRGEETARRTRVLITTDAPGARISLDGAPAAASPLIKEVEPGKHHVQVDAPGYFTTTRDVTAIAGELILTPMPLRERPSTLSIWTPDDAEIHIDGAYVSQGGDGVLVQLPSGVHRLAVARKGHRVAVREVKLERGKASTIRVELEPTSQRAVSEVLFMSGGAALGASLVMSAFAIRSEGAAEDFLRRQGDGNVTEADRLRYNTSLADRDRFRLAAQVSLAASAGLFITGLFMHELDHPNPQQLYRTAPRAGADATPPAPVKPRVQITPEVSGSTLGLTFGGQF